MAAAATTIKATAKPVASAVPQQLAEAAARAAASVASTKSSKRIKTEEPQVKSDSGSGDYEDDAIGDSGDGDETGLSGGGGGASSAAAAAAGSGGSEPYNKASYVSTFAQRKRQRTAEEKDSKTYKPLKEKTVDGDTKKVIAQFQSADGKNTGSQLEIPIDTTIEQLQLLINSVLANDEKLPYSFFLNEEEITAGIEETLNSQKASTENVLSIIYQPQAIFRVQSVTRCTSTIEGHAEAVLSVHFSSDGKHLASGSGDSTVRLWDVGTELPKATLKGHSNWVMCVAWAPNGKVLASGSMDNEIRIWDAVTGKAKGKPLRGHKKWITALAWEPMTTNYACTRLASASKDNTVRIWDAVKQHCLFTLSHSNAVKALKWGGAGMLYSASQDRTIKVWDPNTGKVIRTLEGHGHWVNTLALNTDYALRIGPYDHTGQAPEKEEDAKQRCKDAYAKVLKDCGGKELLISGSDDFTLFLWDPATGKKPLARLTGHQQPVNYVSYSPDGRLIASGSFDGSVRLWNGLTGKFMATFRGHVQAVYQCCWSADSRLLVSGSKDSTMKVWDVKTKKLKCDLPGHADEVFAVDWSPDGERVCSGGKYKVLKIWRH